ncbi:MAG: cytochrome C oxidase subunit IV family protein [Pseudobdellovibrio sp.]|nr:cytochrome C oxidase subunit IV family protein [Pseudobdellovibrio sp.]
MAHGHKEQLPNEHHITPFATYIKVAAALFALTFLTVGAHAIHQVLGPAAPLIAFAIAAVKAFLVMAFFMHLKYESMENRIIFSLGFLFLLLLFGISITDILSRHFIGGVL